MSADLSQPLTYGAHVIRLRHFWWSLVRHDLRVRYRHSFFGIAWALGRPAGMTAVLAFVFSSAFQVPLREYVPFLFVSLSLWQFVSETAIAGCGTFRAGAGYVRQQPLPLLIFPLRTVLGTSVHAGFALGVGLLLTAACVGLPPVPLLLAAVPGVLLLLLAGLVLAIVLGIMHTYFTDTQHVVEAGLQVLFYVTPVMYRPTVFAHGGWLQFLVQCNPCTAFLELVREPLLSGGCPAGGYYFEATLVLLALGTLAWLLLRRFERDLVYWI